MKRYCNTYRITTARAQWWDYDWNGAYFVTICTQNRAHLFGDIVKARFIASQMGQLVETIWHEIPNHAPFVELGDFMVMPNHIHGILILDKPDGANEMGGNDGIGTDTVETLHATSLHHHHQQQQQPPGKNEQMAAISPKSNSISTIIRSYKSAVTKHANRLGLENGWQARFHDHIIRNDAEYQRISDYIVNNPQNWNNDKFNDNL